MQDVEWLIGARHDSRHTWQHEPQLRRSWCVGNHARIAQRFKHSRHRTENNRVPVTPCRKILVCVQSCSDVMPVCTLGTTEALNSNCKLIHDSFMTRSKKRKEAVRDEVEVSTFSVPRGFQLAEFLQVVMDEHCAPE